MKTIYQAIKESKCTSGDYLEQIMFAYEDKNFDICFSAEKENDYLLEVDEFSITEYPLWIETEPTPGQLIQMQKIINDKVAELMDNESRAANDAFTDLDREIQSNDFYNGK